MLLTRAISRGFQSQNLSPGIGCRSILEVIGLKKKVWEYKEIVRKLLNEQPLTADKKTFLKKEEVTAKKG